jgi:hypothetical protein
LLACGLGAAGCAGRAPQPALEDVPELTEVPFFPQSEFDCGPAALATILNWANVTVAPEQLIEAVYIEGLKGSLQAELLAATRRYGLLPIPVPPDAPSLLAEVESGRPVLVLQNLAFKRAPAWHYAVVVGYDAATDRVVLRSGEERRRLERVSRFLRSWELADHWAFVAAEPGDLPVTATPDIYMRAVVGSEHVLAEPRTTAAYAAALARWPDDSFVVFLAGVREHAAGNLEHAAGLYRRVLASDPGHAAARNNLANALLEQGCVYEALHEAHVALEAMPPGGDFRAEIVATIEQIEAAPRSSAEPAVCTQG